jgi:SAM-dependent methyltransferase
VVKAWLKDLVRNLTGYGDDRAALARLEERMDALSEPHRSSYASARLERLRPRTIERQRELSERLVCPACLSSLDRSDGGAELVCTGCGGRYEIRDDVPVMLVTDPNWPKKQDEIDGEVAFNTRTVPQHVHQQRNDFVDQHSRDLLEALNIDLSRDEVLIVGCSMAEALFFEPLTRLLVALEIVPEHTVIWRKQCVHEGRNIAWVCGDGECLPFVQESFDAVIVRQSLHHMLKYYSAISEFFRVCRVGGRIIIIEEPYSQPNLTDAALADLPDDYLIYGSVYLSDLRRHLGLPGVAPTGVGHRKPADLDRFEPVKDYIPAVAGNSESLLADKYHAFSAVNLIFALRLHTDVFELLWPDTIAWLDHEKMAFCTGPNPAVTKPMVERLAGLTTLSVVARKLAPTTALRNRDDLKALSKRAAG